MGGRVWAVPTGFGGERPSPLFGQDRCFGVKDVNNEWLFQRDVVVASESGQWLLECERGTGPFPEGTKIKAPEASRLPARWFQS